MARNRLTSEEFEPSAGESSDIGQVPAQDAGAETPPAPEVSLAPSPAAAPVPETEVAPPPAPTFTVAAGCSLHCLKGVIRAGKPVRAMDLAGGQAAIDELGRSGHVDRSEA